MRPDELTSQAQIEKNESFTKKLKSGAKTAVGLATSAAGLGLGAKILPFINEFIPTDLAVKGISKVSPQAGDLLRKGMSQGLDVKDGLQFLKESFAKQGEAKKTQENRSIIEQYSPELNQFIQGEIQKGRTPMEAGALAQLQKGFKKVISQMTKDHNIPFSAILQTAFGEPGMAQGQPQQAQQPQGQPAQGQQQPGQGQQALMAILQKLQQSRGG